MELLNQDERAFASEMRAFVQSEIAPRARDIDRHDEVPEDIFEKLHPYLVLTAPREYGGGGREEMYACLLVEQLGYACPALVPYIEVGQLFGKALEIAGTEKQKREYIGRLAQGQLGAYALTDRTPGSDPANMETTARRADPGYELTGGKRHITFFERADMMVLFARDNDKVSAFFFQKPFEGIEVVRRSEWIGLRGHKAWDLRLDRAPCAELIGPPGSGLKTALTVLSHTRISLACGHVGLGQAALDVAANFAKERIVGGKPLWQHEAIGFALVDAQIRIDGARLLAYQAARLAERGEDCRGTTAMAKSAAAEALLEAVTVCNRTLGGYGGHLDYPAERYLRDAFSWVAAQGTLEVQKLTAARALFGA